MKEHLNPQKANQDKTQLLRVWKRTYSNAPVQGMAD
jgi:hypothetical protein